MVHFPRNARSAAGVWAGLKGGFWAGEHLTLVLDTARAMGIALGMGAAGLPLAWWLFRSEGFSKTEKTMLGLCLGWVLIALMFTAEAILGVKYTQFLVYAHWALLVALGAALWAREIMASKNGLSSFFKPPSLSLDWPAAERALPSLGLIVLIVLSVWIPLSASGILLSEVDPYFYLYGVSQVVTRGASPQYDYSVWYPTLEFTHLGQPLYKFLIAPWYTLYAQGAPYSPYMLSAVASIYAPLMMGLSVFFIYLLFKELYGARAGLLAGGILAFLPIMLQKMHAGDSQVVPYGTFGLIFFLAALVLMAKRRSAPLFTISIGGRKIAPETFTLLAILGACALNLGSNLEILLVFCISIFLFMVGFMHLLKPTPESRALVGQLGWYFLPSLLVICVANILYWQRPPSIDWASDLLKNVAVPSAALLVPVLFGAFIDRMKWPAPKQGQVSLPIVLSLLLVVAAIFRLWGALAILPLILFGLFLNSISQWVRRQPNPARLELCLLLLAAILLVCTEAPVLPISSSMFDAYRFWGAYSNAVTRTIAEQAAGPDSFDSALGAASITFGPAPDAGQLFSMAAAYAANSVQNLAGLKLLDSFLSLMGLINLLPTLLLNVFYNSAAGFMNVYLAKDGVQANFPITDRTNSMATFFMFFGPALLAIALLRSWKAGRPLPYGPMLLLSFIVPITFMGFMKVKFLVWLAVVFALSVAAAWGEGERLLREWLDARHAAKHKAEPSGWMAQWPVNPRHLAWTAAVLAILLQMGWPTYLAIDANPSMPADYTVVYAQAAAILATSGTPAFYQNPQAALPLMQTDCTQHNQAGACAVLADWNASLSDPAIFYRSDICYLSLAGDLSARMPQSRQAGAGYRCSLFPTDWLAAYDWMEQNVPRDSRITSWWDYGHWTLFFGQTNTVLDPTQASGMMIGRIAYAYVHADPANLREAMKAYGSRYALFDMQIAGNGGSGGSFIFGGKFSALNYLGCDWAKRTNYSQGPGTSLCELSNQPERLVVPIAAGQSSPCTISESTQSKGVIGYRAVLSPSSGGVVQNMQPVYCVRQEQTSDGQPLGVYFLNQADANGNLPRSPAYWLVQSSDSNQLVLAALYSQEPWQLPNGTIVSRWDYRQGPYYDTSLYQAFFLRNLEGFDLVYDSPTIRIFKMQDKYWNNQTS